MRTDTWIPRDPDVFGQPTRPWHRVEIYPQLVRMIEVIRAHGMRMQLEAREVGHPGQRRRVTGDDFLGGAA
jgi:hypothetical protein